MELELDGHGYPTEYKRGYFENKVICVFGGTGTIGSLIVEYLITQKPSVIRIFSNDENSLWESEQKWGDNKIRYLLGDIRDYNRVKRALKGVHYVFNCAAVKHVPFAEYNPQYAKEVNQNGLENIIDACVEQKIEKLLQVSTDKAVEPVSVMGLTKMYGERLLQIRWAQNPYTKMVCVRLGNVLGSRGSIIPLIKECKSMNKPFPLTSPDMIRYFMKPQEVIKFIMKVFREGGDGEIFIPKLDAVNILEKIHGELGEYPYEIIGCRKGEKLCESLITEQELEIAEEYETYWIIRNEIKL